MKPIPAPPSICLNCGYNIDPSFDYCPNCGQHIREPRLPLKRFIADFFQDYLALDSRIPKSLKNLIIKPGLMTREFNFGKRISYIPPFRLFIFTSFIYFFALAWVAPDESFKLDIDPEQIEFNLSDSLDVELPLIIDSLAIRDSLLPGNPELNDAMGVQNAIIQVDTTGMENVGMNEIEEFIISKLKRINERPELFKESLFNALSITVFFLLPVFGMILWLTHFRKSPYFVEHLVYSAHFHTFIFMLFLFMLIASKLGFTEYWLLIPVSYIYFILSLRTAYNQSVGKAITKSLIIVPMYTFLLSLSLILAVLAGAYIV